jgi:hypothetical protein
VLANQVRVRTIEISSPINPQLQVTLFEIDANEGSLSWDREADFRRIGTVISRLSFALQTPFQVFSARIVPKGLKQGDAVTEVVFNGPPPGIALFESRVGYKKAVEFDPAFLAGEVPPEVEAAISWYLMGRLAPNAVQQVLFQWIGLEALAPPVTGPWQCRHPECQKDIPQCPHCGRPTEGPKSVRSIREYVIGTLGASRVEFDGLYRLRNSIAHGGLAMDPDGIDKATSKTFRIQELLLHGIKKRLGWPLTKPPIIAPEGLTIIGVPGLEANSTVSSDSFYDQPWWFPT